MESMRGAAVFPEEWEPYEWTDATPPPVPPEDELAALAASGELHEANVRDVEGVTVQLQILVAAQYAGFARVLRDAAETPDPWVGPDPTLDPLWSDPRDRSAAQVRGERREVAVRAAVADLAVRVGLSETMIRTRAFSADTLRTRCPLVWDAFLAGAVAEQNAVASAQFASSLPANDPDAWAAFDVQVAKAATTLPPGKFRTRARVVRERVHREGLQERHRRAAADRGVWLRAELDGMAAVNVLLPAADAHAVFHRLDATARHLRVQEGEERTLAQLRADVFADILTTGGDPDRSDSNEGKTGVVGDDDGGRGHVQDARGVRASVAITVPVMTLLGRSDEPATLEGYGPIDPDTARRLAGGASSWVRILTHPVTGTILDVDRKTYRVPQALRRWLGLRDPVCVFPGCTRRARDCHIDHRLDWQYGGATADTNLAPLCEPHHGVKHKSKWVLYRDPVSGATWWVTPTALTVPCDPPPW